MKKVVLTVKEDVCAVNCKDPAATELIEKMKLWGDVTDFDDEVKAVKAEYQRSLDNLAAQVNAIKEQELTTDEIVLLNAYRDCKTVTGDAYLKRIAGLEQCLEEVRVASKKRAEQIAQLVQELAEANG